MSCAAPPAGAAPHALAPQTTAAGAPGDGTLFWDRLPMTIAFRALLAGAIGERFGETARRCALWPLLALGAASLMWWCWSGDLRPYVWVQFYPCLALPIRRRKRAAAR
jgi:hypothetical protein